MTCRSSVKNRRRRVAPVSIRVTTPGARSTDVRRISDKGRLQPPEDFQPLDLAEARDAEVIEFGHIMVFGPSNSSGAANTCEPPRRSARSIELLGHSPGRTRTPIHWREQMRLNRCTSSNPLHYIHSEPRLSSSRCLYNRRARNLARSRVSRMATCSAPQGCLAAHRSKCRPAHP